MTGIRCRSTNRSTGASAAKPIGRGSPGGFRTISSAGRSVMLVRKAMIIPEPAICAEFGEAPVRRRQERREPHRGRRRGERQRRARLSCGASQRGAQIAVIVTFCAVAHAELEPEIDAEAHEQHEKRHRDHVQRADQEQAESYRDRQTDDQADGDREDDPQGVQRQPQNDENRKKRHGGVQSRVVLQGRELVVIDRHEPGQADPRLIIASRLRSRAVCAIASVAARPGCERAEIEHRLDLDEAAQLARLRRFAAGEDAPRKACGPAGEHLASRCRLPWSWAGSDRRGSAARIARPSAPSDSARRAPLRLGSAASVPRMGSAWRRPSVSRATSPVGKYNNPFRSKKLPLSGWCTARIRSRRAESAWASLVAARSTSSGVGASTTTRMSGCGKALMYWYARCVHAKSGAKSSLTSVLIAKCRAA